MIGSGVYFHTRSSRARHGGPTGNDTPFPGRPKLNLYKEISTKTGVCRLVLAPIAPRQKAVPRSLSTEFNALIHLASTSSMPEPWWVAHCPIQLSKQHHDYEWINPRTGWNPTSWFRPLFENAPVGRQESKRSIVLTISNQARPQAAALRQYMFCCAKRSLRPTAEKDRDVIFVRASVRPFVKIIITFLCAAYEGVTGSAALWYFETKIFRNLKKDAR